MSEYLEYAEVLRAEIGDFLERSAIHLQPALTHVPCGYHPRHYIPASSLDAHARLRHGDTFRSAANSHHVRMEHWLRAVSGSQLIASAWKFFYSRMTSGSLASGSRPDQSIEGSIISSAGSGIIDAIKELTSSASDLSEVVQRWERVPSEFVSFPGTAINMETLREWIASELERIADTSMDPGGDGVDEELVDYVVGILQHPDFCQPDRVADEMAEFIGHGHAKGFALALWRFMILELGSRVLPHSNPSERQSAVSVETSKESIVLSQPAQDLSSRHKRRRPTYRAKNTKGGPYDLRQEMLANMMARLSEETGRVVVGGEHVAQGDTTTSMQAPRTTNTEWRRFTDALQVRDMNRVSRATPSTIHHRHQSRYSSPLRSRPRRQRSSSPPSSRRYSSSNHGSSHRESRVRDDRPRDKF